MSAPQVRSPRRLVRQPFGEVDDRNAGAGKPYDTVGAQVTRKPERYMDTDVSAQANVDDEFNTKENVNTSFFDMQASGNSMHPIDPAQDHDVLEACSNQCPDSLESEMKTQMYSKGTMLQVFADIFSSGMEGDPQEEQWLETRGRRDLPRSIRRAHLVVKQERSAANRAKKKSDAVHAADSNSNERSKPWQWPAEWPAFATLDAEPQDHAAFAGFSPSYHWNHSKPIRLDLATAVDLDGDDNVEPLSSPYYGYPPSVAALFRSPLSSACPQVPFGAPPRKFRNAPWVNTGMDSPDAARSWERYPGQVNSPTRPWDKKKASPANSGRAQHTRKVDYTTVMLRNIPNKYTRSMLVDKLNGAGFAGDYDFLYLPCDFASSCNVGYAFINFRSVEATQKFMDVFDQVETKRCLTGFNSLKVCEVVRARVQGKNANIQNIQSNPLVLENLKDNPSWMPLVFDSDARKRISKYDSRLGYRSRADEESVKVPAEWKAATSGTSLNGSAKEFFSQEYTPNMDLSANSISSDKPDSINFTTVMLRNIPNKYTRQMLCDRLNESFLKDFDFLYLPIDFVNKCNVGYAFINFRTTEATERFIKMFHQVECRLCLRGFNSVKVCEVTAARLQGKEANIEHLKHGSVMEQIQSRPEWQPLVFDENGDDMEQVFSKRRRSSDMSQAASISGPIDESDPVDVASPRRTFRKPPEINVSRSLRAEAPTFIPTPSGNTPTSHLLPSPTYSESLRAEAPAFIPTFRSSVSTTSSTPLGTPASAIPTPHRTNLSGDLRSSAYTIGADSKGKATDITAKCRATRSTGHEASNSDSIPEASSVAEADCKAEANATTVEKEEKQEAEKQEAEKEEAEKEEKEEKQENGAWKMISNIFKMGMFRGVEQFRQKKGDAGQTESIQKNVDE